MAAKFCKQNLRRGVRVGPSGRSQDRNPPCRSGIIVRDRRVQPNLGHIPRRLTTRPPRRVGAGCRLAPEGRNAPQEAPAFRRRVPSVRVAWVAIA